MLGRERRQLPGDLSVATEGQRRFPPFLLHLQPIETQLLDLGPSPVEILQLAEGIASPQTQGVIQQAQRRLGILALPGLGRCGTEERKAPMLHGVGRPDPAVARRLGLDPVLRFRRHGLAQP